MTAEDYKAFDAILAEAEKADARALAVDHIRKQKGEHETHKADVKLREEIKAASAKHPG